MGFYPTTLTSELSTWFGWTDTLFRPLSFVLPPLQLLTRIDSGELMWPEIERSAVMEKLYQSEVSIYAALKSGHSLAIVTSFSYWRT